MHVGLLIYIHCKHHFPCNTEQQMCSACILLVRVYTDIDTLFDGADDGCQRELCKQSWAGSFCMSLYDQSPQRRLKVTIGIIALFSSANSLADARQTTNSTSQTVELLLFSDQSPLTIHDAQVQNYHKRFYFLSRSKLEMTFWMRVAFCMSCFNKLNSKRYKR